MDFTVKGDPLPQTDHIARYCRPIHAPNGQVQGSAFLMRPVDEHLSVNWLEYFNFSSRQEEINEVRNVYASKLRVGANAKLAILNVGQVKEKVLSESEDRRNLEILHDPIEDDPPDPSHSGVYNLRLDDELIAELILETVLEVYPARH